MGIATAQFRLSYLLLFKSDLEEKMSQITQTKLGLTSTSSELMNLGTELEPESPELKLLMQRKDRLKFIEDQLTNQMEIYKTQLQAIEAEVQSVESLKNSEIKRAFSYGVGG